MLESLVIKNFRVFESLRLDHLGRVNLFVGKNNSGKTCILDAIRVYGSRGNPRTLATLVKERNEDTLDTIVGSISEHETSPYSKHPFRNLFHGYQFPADSTTEIEIGAVDGCDYLRLSVSAARWNRQEGSDEEYLTFVDIPLDHADIAPSDIVYLLRRWQKSGGREDTLPAFKLEGNFGSDLYVSNRAHAPLVPVRVVPTRPLDNREMYAHWSKVVVRRKLREHVIQGLQYIDPRIQEVVFVGGDGAEPVPTLLFEDESRLPLHGLGDGTAHLFQILVTLVSAKGGFALFDEFENGIHWSVQPMLWQKVFDVATELDIQVFATTHSYDCVDAFKEVTNEHRAEGMLFRLGRSVRESDRGKLVVKAYDKDRLERATKATLEVR